MVYQNEYTLTVDIKKKGINQIPVFVKNDTAILNIRVLDEDVEYDISQADRYTVSFKKPKGELVTGQGRYENGMLVYELGATEMEETGMLEVVAQIYIGETRISTRPFQVKILDDYEGGIGSEEQLTFLQELFIEVNGNGNYAKAQGDYAKTKGDNLGHKGNYNPSVVYKDGNVVTFGGVNYICIKDTTAGIDPTNGTYWTSVSPQATINDKTWTATEGQTVFTITNGQYVIGKGNIEVWVGGVPQIKDQGFTETNSTTITLSEGVPAGTIVYAKWFEGHMTITKGHGSGHEIGGQDEIDVTKLKNYNVITEQLAEKAQFSDVFSAYYSRKNQEYLGMVARKLRYGENVTVTFMGDSNSMRSNSLYQTSFLSTLNGVYLNRISRIDRAYAGDSAKAGHERFPDTHAGDISVICYGTNDSSTQYGYPDATKTKDYIYWMEKLITRELDRGKAVILVSPIPTRNDKRWELKSYQLVTDPYPTVFRADAYVFGNICSWLAEKYSAPFVDSREIIANYEDEIFANSNGNSLGTATTSFGDPVHLTDEGLTIWGTRVASIFVGDSMLRKQTVVDGIAFATRKGEDPFTTNASIFTSSSIKRIKYYSNYAWAVGDNVVGNRSLELQVGEEITYSFYCDTEDLVVYPNNYVFANSIIEVKLDNAIRQPLSTLDEDLKQGANYGNKGTSKITFDTTVVTSPIFNISKGQKPASIVSGARYLDEGIRVSSRGWHTLNIKVVQGATAISGIRFRSQLIERVTSLESAPSLNIKDLQNTDLNTLTVSGVYYAFSATNRPVAINGIVKHSEKTNDNSIALQEYYPYNDTSKQWVRMKVAGTWGAWTQIK